jgi:hypothetical protein
MPSWTWEPQQESSRFGDIELAFLWCLTAFAAACQQRIRVGWKVFLCAPFTGQSSPPCTDRVPEGPITNGGFFLPADLIRSIFLRPLAPRALPRFCATMDALTSTQPGSLSALSALLAE